MKCYVQLKTTIYCIKTLLSNNSNDYSGMDAADLTLYDNDVNPVDVTNERPSMEPLTPQDPTVVQIGVAMIGCGNSNAGGLTWVATNATERGWGEPNNFGRIVFGMGTECGLITSGVISNAAHCPGGIQNDDNVTYNDYILLLPRLEATANRMGLLSGPITDNDAGEDGLQITGVAYDEEPVAAYDHTTNTGNLKVRVFTIDEAQEGWQFATMCPEGHLYPADDEEFWGVDLDNATGIN